MSLFTNIGWCDSTVNPVMGCDGCELWNTKVQTCYAGIMTERKREKDGTPFAGWPKSFDEPARFPGRMAKAAKWPDLRGRFRPEKPWIPSAMPRLVFISDMGDALSRRIPFEFLLEEIVKVVALWPHIGLWLTKQPRRLAEFSDWLVSKRVKWPRNLWPGTSVTDPGFAWRLRELRRVGPLDLTRFASFEPILGPMSVKEYLGPMELASYSAITQRATVSGGLSWGIVGLESGPERRDCGVAPLINLVQQFQACSLPVFVKQDAALQPGLQGRLPAEVWNVKEFPALTLPAYEAAH